MSLRTENISLNCKKAYFQTIIENLHVGDVKSTQLVFTLTDGIKEIELPDGKTTAIIHGKKPDGTEIHNDCTVENNKIYYTLTAQDTAVSGIVDYMLDVTVNRDENYERAYMPTFRTRVSDRIYSPAYRELETEPDNWETEYKNYYRKEGNAYIQIADNVCPTFVPKTFYVLVDPPVESASEFLAFYSAFNKVSELFDKRLVIDSTTTDIEYSPDNIHKVFIYATIVSGIKGIVFTGTTGNEYAICSDGLLRTRTYSGSYSDWSVVALNTSIDDTNKNENNRVPSIKAVVDYIASAISGKADTADVNAALATKANKTYVDTELGKKADINHTHPVDSAFSQTSTNPVQNNTVTEKFNIVINNVNTALAGKANVNHTHDMSNYVTLQAMIAALASKADISDIPSVPTNVSAFNNDAGYITSSDIDLSGKANYREVNIENINNATNPNTVYRVLLGMKDGAPEYATIICPRSGDLSNLNHTQYAFTNLGRVLIRKCINGVWESSFTDLIPEGADVSGKADKSYVDTELAKKADKTNTYSKSEVDSEFVHFDDFNIGLNEKEDVAAKVTSILNPNSHQYYPSAKAVKEFVEGKGYLTSHQDISGKVDKVIGKGLSTNDYTTAEKNKLAALEPGNSIWKTTTAPTAPDAEQNLGYGFTISTLTGADRDVQIGDMVLYSYYYYTVTEIIGSVAYAESRVSIRGAKGATGAKGDDYVLTDKDKADIAGLVDTSGKADKSTTLSGYGITDAYTKGYIDQKLLELGGANVVNSVSDMVDTSRLYVLAETGHIWRYATTSTEPPNELDVKYYNKRISGSAGIDGVAANGYFINERIPVDLTGDSCIITFKNFASNMGTLGTNEYGNSKICGLDEQGALITGTGNYYISRRSRETEWGCPISGNDCVGDAVTYAELLISDGIITSKSDIKYLLFAPQMSTSAISAADMENLGIYVSTHGGTTTAWVDTGITYGGGNEEVLTSLDIRMTAAENNIAELAESSTGVVIPSYWQTEVDDTVSKIKALQDASGSNLLCFGWCSDMHIPVNGTAYEQNIGSVAARVMKECNIPLFLMTGDMLTADTSTDISAMPTAYKKAWEYLSPIGKERIIAVKGNHDAWAGDDGNGNYYVKGLPPEKLYNQIFAPQTEDFKREFGADGSYFFIDYKPQKTRFICLNSQWAAYEENPDGTAKYSTQKGAGFGQTQLDWLIQKALNVESGYSVIIAFHVPPTAQTHSSYQSFIREYDIIRGIITAYCNKTTYSGSYTHSTKGTYLQEGTWADVNISCDFGSYNGTLLGLFCGHSHYDQFVTNDLPVPIICITSAINTPYDTSASVRVLGTKDETAFDFVCINRSTGQINTVRCGYGNDRVIQ